MKVLQIAAVIAALFQTAAAAQPKRIISTAPSITETLFVLGAGDRVIGVSTFCHYPAEAAKRTKVGTFMHPNAETILSLKPDLVLMQRVPGETSERLRRLGLNVVEIGHGDLEHTLASIVEIGKAAGAEQKAHELVREIRGRFERVKKATEGKPRRSVVFVVGRMPGQLAGMVVVGKGSYLNDLLAVAGGRNLFAEASMQYWKISLEQVLGGNPGVIIDMGDMADTVRVTEEKKASVVGLWSKYPMIEAVKAARVHAVASDIFVVPGPRVVEAAEAFARMIHPEVRW
ncbi:MAG: ABC transporter substrate-binding protein [Acidimicrobiia bacterium]|nr:ABC transporter substrate-binding protein [Acidimicrobiia bacterium]